MAHKHNWQFVKELGQTSYMGKEISPLRFHFVCECGATKVVNAKYRVRPKRRKRP